jgi:hypothetical protein
VIFGTEPVRIDVAGQPVDAAALAALPPAVLDVRVNYKVHWPAEPVRLHGVRLDALLDARQITLPPGARVLVQGKAPIQRDPAEPLSFAAADLARCEITLATHWGADRAPITARLGGPVTLALSPACAAEYGDKYWITFVEHIEVIAP